MSISKAYKLYLFDLDGTLVDTKLDIALAMQKVLGDAGLYVPSLDEVEKAIGGGAINAVGKLTGMDDDALTPLLDAFIAAYEELCADHTEVYAGGEALLKRLKSEGAKLAVVTMKLRAPTHKILKHHGLLSLLDDVLSFDDLEKRKPEPDSLLALAQKHGITPQEVLVIGDTVTDIRYAQNAGADVCAVEYGYGELKDIVSLAPNRMVKSLFEI